MINTNANVLSVARVEKILLFIGLMAIAIVIPHYVHNQFITGPIVNAVLFISAVMLGTGNAILIGLFPSMVALVSGLLPVPLAPMVPLIMISNTILIVVFSYFRKVNYCLDAQIHFKRILTRGSFFNIKT